MTTAAAVLAAPAQADTIDDTFLAALTNGGLNSNNPANTVALGQAGVSDARRAGQVARKRLFERFQPNGIPPEMAAFFTGIAISMYCPSDDVLARQRHVPQLAAGASA